MDKVSADELSRYTKSQEKPGEGIEKPKPKEEKQANMELRTDGTATAPIPTLNTFFLFISIMSTSLFR